MDVWIVHLSEIDNQSYSVYEREDTARNAIKDFFDDWKLDKENFNPWAGFIWELSDDEYIVLRPETLI